MDADIVAAKLEGLRHCLERVQARCPPTADDLAHDMDAQDIVTLNLSRAVQLCVDLALHWLANSGTQAPETMGGAFEPLVAAGVIDVELGRRLRAAVGFRNLAVHQYQAIDWHIVHAIVVERLDDFRRFACAISDVVGSN